MSLRTRGRHIGATLAVTGALVSFLGIASAATASSSGTIFTGGGRGPTAEVAIQGAIDDATNSANSVGLFTCTPVGEPQVFESLNDPNFGHTFRAQADVSCTP
jgi:hypothetical protein